MSTLRFKSLLTIALSFSIIACGSSSDVNLSGEENESEGSTPTPAEEQIETRTEYFGEKGNLWKPRADENSSTSGLLVVLLSSEYTDVFDSCAVPLLDGTFGALDCNDRVEWSHHPFSCVANEGREHWRAYFTCDKAAMVQVICRNATQRVTFEAKGAGISATCSRHD